MRKPTLTVTVGLPGSGKSTWARAVRDLTREAGRMCAVVDRDSIRDLIGYRWDAPADQRARWEQTVTTIQHAQITACLRAGIEIIVADTNLVPQHLDALRSLARRHRAAFEVRDFTAVPVDECIRRDALRPPYVPGGPCSGVSVGETVIRRMWRAAVGKLEAVEFAPAVEPEGEAW